MPIRPRCAAALALLGQASIGPRGRRIAVLGEMLELGPSGRASCIAAWWGRSWTTPSISCSAAGRSTAACGRPFHRHAGAAMQGHPAALEAAGVSAHCRRRRGHGQGLAWLANGAHRQGARQAQFVGARRRRSGVRSGLIRCFTGWIDLSDKIHVLQRVPLSSPCAPAGAMITGAVIRVPVRPVDHRSACGCARAKASRSAADGPQSHIITKTGTPTMGGLMILSGMVVVDFAVGQSAQSLRLDRAVR